MRIKFSFGAKNGGGLSGAINIYPRKPDDESTFDLVDLPFGIYLVKVIDGNSVLFIRFVKN